jgi:hypothetical protein
MHRVGQTRPLYPPSENKGEDSPYLTGFPSARIPRGNLIQRVENPIAEPKTCAQSHLRESHLGRHTPSFLPSMNTQADPFIYSLPLSLSLSLSPLKKSLLCFLSPSYSFSFDILLLVREEPLVEVRLALSLSLSLSLFVC